MWHVEGLSGNDEIVDTIARDLDDGAEFLLAKNANLTVSPNEFRSFLANALKHTTSENRRRADILAAYGSEQVTNRLGDVIQTTALCLIRGQGHQNFLESIRAIAGTTTRTNLHEALFVPWRYQDERPSFRWDPTEDRRYALRATDPSKTSLSPIRTMRGANRLAIEALPLFPTTPSGRSLNTTGFTHTGREWLFSWPVWRTPITGATLRSLLTLSQIHEGAAARAHLNARGVVAVFQCLRFHVGERANFSPAVALWEVDQ